MWALVIKNRVIAMLCVTGPAVRISGGESMTLTFGEGQTKEAMCF